MTLTTITLIIAILFGTLFIFNVLRDKRKRQSGTASRTKRRSAPRKEPTLGKNPLPEVKVPSMQPKAPIEPELANTPAEKTVSDKQDLVVVRLVAPDDESYCGYELLQTILAAGFRYGEDGFFHRHAKKTGNGPILFSLASMSHQGTFDLTKMGAYSCSGLVLYMDVSKLVDPLEVYKIMLNTIDELITELGGEAQDTKQRKLTVDLVMEEHKRLAALSERLSV